MAKNKNRYKKMRSNLRREAHLKIIADKANNSNQEFNENQNDIKQEINDAFINEAALDEAAKIALDKAAIIKLNKEMLDKFPDKKPFKTEKVPLPVKSPLLVNHIQTKPVKRQLIETRIQTRPIQKIFKAMNSKGKGITVPKLKKIATQAFRLAVTQGRTFATPKDIIDMSFIHNNGTLKEITRQHLNALPRKPVYLPLLRYSNKNKSISVRALKFGEDEKDKFDTYFKIYDKATQFKEYNNITRFTKNDMLKGLTKLKSIVFKHRRPGRGSYNKLKKTKQQNESTQDKSNISS